MFSPAKIIVIPGTRECLAKSGHEPKLNYDPEKVEFYTPGSPITLWGYDVTMVRVVSSLEHSQGVSTSIIRYTDRQGGKIELQTKLDYTIVLK